MNQTEELAYKWLIEQPDNSEIVFQRRDSPDFINQNGSGYEVKLLKDNHIVFTYGQLRKLLKFGKATVLVMAKGKAEPVAQIPIEDLKDNPDYWNQYHIVSYEFPTSTTIFHCLACGEPFQTNQGSRRKYCDDCAEIRIKSGKKQWL